MKTNINIILKITLLIIVMSPTYQVFSFFDNYEGHKSIKSTRSDSWILDLQQNGFNNLQWYYNNLNNQDRLKIRQAFDWCIDRNHIINDIENGFGLNTLSYFNQFDQYFLNNGTVARQLDLPKAKSLLTEVFGYTYDPITNNPATPYDETKPYFKFTEIYPSNNFNRIQWSNEIADNWKSIGIDVNIVDLGTGDSIYSYLRTNESDIGYGYGFGGFDVLFVAFGDIGWSTYSPDLAFSNYNETVQPNSSNDPNFNQIINKSLYEQDTSLRNQALYDYQQWMYDNVPISYLFAGKIVNIKNKDLEGIDPSVETNYENWSYTGHENATIMYNTINYDTAFGQLSFLNPVFYPYQGPGYVYRDTQLVGDAIFRGMFYRSAIFNQGTEKTSYYPYFADWYNKSADGKTWFVNLKQGLKWHDGVELNSSDIKFTFDTYNLDNATLAAATLGIKFQPWNPGNIQTSVINSTLVKFELEKPYSFFKEDFLTVRIIPKHILGNIPLADWFTDPSNTGINGTAVGNGPYTFVNKSKDQTAITLQKWSDWDANYQSLISNNAMNDPIPDLSAPTLKYINFISVVDPVDALNFVKNGSADITLQKHNDYNFKAILNQITDPAEPIIEKGIWTQVILYNLKSPIWGMNAVEPCTIYENLSCSTPIPPTSTPPTTTSSEIPSADFNSPFIFLAFLTISVLTVYKRKTKLN